MQFIFKLMVILILQNEATQAFEKIELSSSLTSSQAIDFYNPDLVLARGSVEGYDHAIHVLNLKERKKIFKINFK